MSALGPDVLTSGVTLFSGQLQCVGSNGQFLLALSNNGLSIGNTVDNANYSFLGTGSLTAGGFIPTSSNLLAPGIYRPSAGVLGFSTAVGQVGQVDQNGNWFFNAFNTTPVTVFGTVTGGAMTVNYTNLSTGAGNDTRLVLQAGSTQTALYSVNQNATAPIINNGPIGPQAVLRTFTAAPIIFGTNNILRGQIGTANGSNLQWVDDGGSLQVVGWRDTPQNAQSGPYTLDFTDRGGQIYFVGAGTTLTISSNTVKALPVGMATVVVNDTSGNVAINISTDTLQWSPSGLTGNRILATKGECVLKKVTANKWWISGSGLS